MKKIFILYIFIICFPFLSFAQKTPSKHHYFKARHKIVSDKQYEQKTDSSFFAYELFIANMNTWTGENYMTEPSLQFLVTYDNNKNFEIGLFSCLNPNGFNGGNFDGIDLFLSHKIIKNFTLILDDYIFVSRKYYLNDYFGYDSKTYNLYTARLKYDLGLTTDFILAYSIFNNKDSLQQELTLECDYNINDNLTLSIAYGVGPNVLKINDGTLSTNIGLTSKIWEINGSPISFGVSLMPFYYNAFFINETNPFMFALSVDF